MTESGAGVYQAYDACHSINFGWCAQITDGEFPTSTESDEAGDPGVTVVVESGGSSYSVVGDPAVQPVTYISE
jgi:hypothetical protein